MTITTTKSPKGRISVSTSGITGMDKVVNYAFDVIDNGEDVILKNEHGDTCTLDDSLFLHGSYNVKFAIRQFAKGERVTGAIVLNGKEYPVVKAEDIIAEGERRRAMREVSDKPTWEDPHKYETVGNLEKVRNLTPEWRIYRTEDDDLVEKLTVNGEELTFINGAPNHIHSDTYKAGFSYFSCKFYSMDKKYKTIHEEEEFFAIMADRGACTLEPVNNELIAADYEFTDRYNEFGADTRRFKIGDETITFYRNRWVEIDSPKLCAKIDRSIYYDEINYNLDEWAKPSYHELPHYNVPAAKFWWSMYKRGFMQRATPFRITLEHDDAPATVHEITDLDISYTPNGKNYDMIIDDGEIIVLATVDNKRIFDFAESIRLAFANSAGVTIDSKGEITIIADEAVYLIEACAEINRHAPEGWTINFDTQKKFFPVKYNGKQVTTVDSLATQKILSPEKFFEQFKPLVDKNFTPRDQFLADRYNELAMLEQMREEIDDDDVAQLKTLEEMIDQVKRDIAAEEFAG